MNKSDIHRLFHICDQQGFERPHGLDAGATKKMVHSLKFTLDALLPLPVQGPFEDQDCTYCFRLPLPREICLTGNGCDLYVSNFGKMIAIQNDQYLIPEYLAAIKNAAEDNGFQWINESDLRSRYDGQCHPGFSTWWHRFFDYV